MKVLLRQGLVIAAHGRHVWVEDGEGQRWLCHPRGKKNLAVVGDRVEWMPTGDEGLIETIVPRRNLLYRQDDIRIKSFAANLDQVVVLLAAEPVFSESQLNRALIAAQAADISPLVVLNKQDLADAFDLAWKRLEPYRRMGVVVMPLCLKTGAGLPRSRSDSRIGSPWSWAPQAWAKAHWSTVCCPERAPPRATFRKRSTPAGTPPPAPSGTGWMTAIGAPSSTHPGFRNSDCSTSPPSNWHR